MRIDIAYCIELGRVVNIQEACREFSSQGNYKKFNFLCSDLACRDSRKGGVRITGVNHHKLPTEEETHKSPHFRILDEHLPNCIWMELDVARGEEEHDERRTFTEYAHRKQPKKHTHLVTHFIIPGVNEQDAGSVEVGHLLNEIRLIASPLARRKALLHYAQGAGATATSLEALVSCYEELKASGELGREFSIPGKGSTSFHDAFRPVSEGVIDREFVVRYGGARLPQNFGEGFSLKFFDPIEDIIDGATIKTPVTIYVSAEDLMQYRPGERFKKLVAEMRGDKVRRPYLRVYWIGFLKKRENGSYSANFSSLAHVVMRLVYPREQSTQSSDL